MTQSHREWARRRHIDFANFAVDQCWVNGLDAIAFDKKQLMEIIGLETLEIPYVAWIREDISALFPYSFFTYLEDSLSSLFISRIHFPPMPEHPMDDDTRMQYLKDFHLKIDRFHTVEEDADDNHLPPSSRRIDSTSEETDADIEDMNEYGDTGSSYDDDEDRVWGDADWADFFGCDEDDLESAFENQSYHDN